ncbi:MAG TPA: class I SAM-dependent methyltransferase [Deltaproteobacteria bacterium]|nr:class I SAM-dependent methyltransferase [Deltaproteobacteria bacterium]
MAHLTPFRRLLKLFHPEGIPSPGTKLYNKISKTGIFQRNYDLLAQDILRHCKEGNCLDVGMGPGWLLIKLHKQSPALHLHGIDISPSMVEKAKTNVRTAGLAGIIDLKTGDASHIPYGDGSFDAVVSTGSIHHWKEPVRALNEIHRVLKHGGYALVYDVLSDTPQSVLNEAAREFGRLRMLLLWLHAFEEPFYSRQTLEMLPEKSLFKQGSTHFAGVLCCLAMKKET